MNMESVTIHRALLSVSDKTGIIEFAKFLTSQRVEILSTGGTAKTLSLAGIPVLEVSDYTKFPEMMDGRVKTLHPKIHGGILGRRDQDDEIASAHGIKWIDIIICNLYPFEKATANPSCTESEARDQIDIGGPSMVRSAAKNYEWVTVVIDPSDYSIIQEELMRGGISFGTRKKLALKAFAHTSAYDALISDYFAKELLPQNLLLPLHKQLNLRYGENPHQQAAYYSLGNSRQNFPFTIHQGKQLSYNNFLDVDAAWRCVQEFQKPACVIIKHGNPCGAALGNTVIDVYAKALEGDPVSAFGGIVAFNDTVSESLAEQLVKTFYEVIVAPGYDDGALLVLSQKKNLRVLTMHGKTISLRELRSTLTGVLIQEPDTSVLTQEMLSFVTSCKPNDKQIKDLLFAWKIVKNVKSNAIVIAKNEQLVGIGSGHVSRIDSVECAVKKSGDKMNDSVLASDAFFPFRDSIDRIAKTGVTAIIQPGGSLKDSEVITACNEYNFPMVFTGVRVFKH